ncbi:hypothetical protein FRB95_001249 [Tulasnella sp. JGI-2019a]|nr:hypothetical protein FRB95_001249 [Tulasnella sp. JGI-2019a]
MEAARNMIISKLNKMTMQLADWSISKLSAFATQPFSALVPEPLPPTPTRTYYIPIPESFPTIATPSSAIATGSALQRYTILVLIILTTSVILLTALRFCENGPPSLFPSFFPSLTPLDPTRLGDLTSDDIAEAKDMSSDDLYRLVCFLFGKCEEQEHKITSLYSKINNPTVAEMPNAPSAPPTQTSNMPQSNLDHGRSDTHTPLVDLQLNVTLSQISEPAESRTENTPIPAEAHPTPPPPPATSDPEFELLPELNHAPLLFSKLLFIASAIQRLEHILKMPLLDPETANWIMRCDYRIFSNLVGPRLAYVEDRIILHLMHLEGRNKLVADLADLQAANEVLCGEFNELLKDNAKLVAASGSSSFVIPCFLVLGLWLLIPFIR